MEESYLSSFNFQHLENELELKRANGSSDQQVPKFIIASEPNTCQTFSIKETVVCINRKMLNENGNYFFQSNKMKGHKVKTTRKLTKKRKPRGNYPVPDSPSLLPSSPREIKLHCSKQKEQTPLQSSLKLMQKHRENERVRHQTLNELMKRLRSQIPGNDEYSKGTKVVTMQQAICYIVYLEKMITNVCKELDMELDNSKSFLTSKLTHEDLRKTLWGQNNNRFENTTYQCRQFPSLTQADSQKFTHKNPTKMCSTMLNSTDNCLLPLKEDSLSEVGHFPGLSLSDEYFHEPLLCCLKSKTPASGGFNSMFDNSTGLQSFDSNNDASVPESNHSTDNTYPELNDFVPICKQAYPNLLNGDPMLPQLIDCPRMMCTKNRKYEVNLVETAEELQFVPPDSVSPVVSINYHSNVPALHESNNDYEMLSERSIEEENESPNKPSLQRPLRGVVGKKSDDQFESYCWKFHEIANIRRQKVELTAVKEERFDQLEEKFETVVERKIREEKLKNPLKVDHRRASWMNGFMMYSQMNRRKYINANPGVHTSHISKMMGHAWRSMPADKQLPYKEKAQKYAQYMQNALMMSFPASNSSATSDKSLEYKDEEREEEEVHEEREEEEVHEEREEEEVGQEVREEEVGQEEREEMHTASQVLNVGNDGFPAITIKAEGNICTF